MQDGIPRRIVQIWGGGAPLSLLSKAASANARLLNPGFEYDFFDDTRIARFIASEFPQHAGVFERFRFPIQRYDFLRYLIVYRYGGFYFDLDLLLAEPLDSLTAHGCVFPFERLTWAAQLRNAYDMDWEVGNYAFGAQAGHPFLRAVIDNCVRALNEPAWSGELIRSLPWMLREELFVIYSTGPGLVSRTLAEYRDAAHPVKVLFPADVSDRKTWNRFGDYGVHLMERSWRAQRNPVARRMINAIGRRNEERAIAAARKVGKTRTPTFAIEHAT